MQSVAAVGPRPGEPRSERDAAFLDRFNAHMRLPIVVAAILPLVVVPQSGDWPAAVVGVVTWAVFVVDYVVHVRHLVRYRRTGYGRFDLFVVLATAPWFLLPGAHAGSFVVLLRLARLARLVVASKGSRRLFERLGRVALLAGGVVVFGSLVAYYAEHPTNPEFATVGDAFWWGIVTLTTVGYGDIVPKTTTGRWAGVTIMITGIAVLGLLSGSLASFFRLDPDADSPSDDLATALDSDRTPDVDRAADTDATPSRVAGQVQGGGIEMVLRELTAEVAALRLQVGDLSERLTAAEPGPSSGYPARPEDASG